MLNYDSEIYSENSSGLYSELSSEIDSEFDSDISSDLEILYFKTHEFKMDLLEKYNLYLERINNKLYKNILSLIYNQEFNNNNFKSLINKTILDFNKFSSSNLANYKILEDDLNNLTNSYNELINDYVILKNKYKNTFNNIEDDEMEKPNQLSGFNSIIYNLKLFSWL